VNWRDKARLSLIPVLAEKHPAGCIGRTALMKFMYFLQTLRDVPLGYSFSMYSYGPFDSDVLSDLSTAESLNLVSSVAVSFYGGYGYRIHATSAADGVKHEAKDFLAEYKDDIDWVVAEFGNLNSAELELASTIVYVDREFAEIGLPDPRAHLVSLVSEIKPHFGTDKIERSVSSLQQKGVLTSI
jgi:hypothetical protein